ncbi:MAG: type II toxin-antitoxin system ParD family antitoxin [Pedosphaera sp.]|nr:type II toxin-antitoxin system ParD family antitoxin [Pedosphaera sp.]
MNVSLTKELESFVSRKVRSGRYGSASEVVRESSRLLEQEDQRKRLSFSTRDELETKLIEGVDALDRGEHLPARDVENELRQRSQKRKKQNA